MKKLLSLILTGMMLVMLAVPCFAVDIAKFCVNIVSESASELVITIDYEGGSTFACYDFEMKFDEKKLAVKSAVDGDGLEAFVKYSKSEGGSAISLVNGNVNPIKGTFATTEPFKVVKGKDLAKITFKKLAKDKITRSDITLVFTNCQTVDFKDVKTDVRLALPSAPQGAKPSSGKTQLSDKLNNNKTDDKKKPDNAATAAADDASKAPDKKPAANVTDTEGKPAKPNDVQSTDQAGNVIEPVENEPQDTESVSTQTNQNNDNNTKKIIIVAAMALCLIFVIVAVCIYVAKKTKKEN